MNYRMISRVLGYVLLIIAALMLLPLIAGLCYRENVLNFVITIGCTATLGFIMTKKRLLLPKKWLFFLQIIKKSLPLHSNLWRK